MASKHTEAEDSTYQLEQKTFSEWMGKKVRFRTEQYKKAFDGLTVEAKNRVAAYFICGRKAKEAVKILGLSGGVETFRKRLADIAIDMGATGLRDLFGDRKLGNESKVTSKSLYKMIKDQDFRCALSGVEIRPETAALDHKKPLAIGGGNDLDNLQWVHRDVNTAKGSMTHEAFVEMCRRVAAWQG